MVANSLAAKRLVVLHALAWLLPASVAVAQAQGRAADPPRIVPWHMIGNAGLGMARDRVEYVYGRRDTALARARYVVSGGTLEVAYGVSGHVDFLRTTSARYRTRDGIGVGVFVPRGACYRTKGGACRFLWRGFTYRGKGLWQREAVRGGRQVIVGLETEKGIIASVHIFFTPSD